MLFRGFQASFYCMISTITISATSSGCLRDNIRALLSLLLLVRLLSSCYHRYPSSML
jgi:hypothetical protein